MNYPFKQLEKNILKNVGDQRFSVHIDSTVIFVHTVEVSGTQTVWSPEFFKINYFMFCRRQKVIQVWNNVSASKRLIFGWTIPLTICLDTQLSKFHRLF